ncbi:MAG: PEP-CTERM sorting domain-containing protein [Acidobacteria bacterium]|nr:PEP-CTERM sorting domain-containing protein [Acidobacteriota bacterium]
MLVTAACQSSRVAELPGPDSSPSGKPGNPDRSRPVYRHSVLPGGAQSGAEVKQKLAQDAPAAAHYRGIDPDRLKPVQLTQDRRAYVSYRVGQKIYWTRKPQLLKAGELVLTDGKQTVRTRCGNRLEDEPQDEVQSADESPADEEFDQIAEPDGRWPAPGTPDSRPGRQLTAITEPLFGWDPGGNLPSGPLSSPSSTPNGGRVWAPPPQPGGLAGIGFSGGTPPPGGEPSPEPGGPRPEGESPFEPPVPPGPGPLPGPPRTPIVPPVYLPPPDGDPPPPELPEPEPEPESPGPKPPRPPVYGPPVPPPPTSPPRESPPGTPPNPGRPTPKGPPPGPEGPGDEPSPKPPRVPPKPTPERPRGPNDFPGPPEPPPSVPEPGSALLLAGGLGVLAWSAYRRRSR